MYAKTNVFVLYKKFWEAINVNRKYSRIETAFGATWKKKVSMGREYLSREIDVKKESVISYN